MKYIETNNGLILDGVFGVNPLVYDGLIKSFGYTSKTIVFGTHDLDKIVQDPSVRTSILCYGFTNPLPYVKVEAFSGAHYININWNPSIQQYEVYNGSDNKFPSINGYLIDNNLIFISLTTIY